MTTQTNSHLLASFKNISQTAGVSVVAMGRLVLAGWQLDIPSLKSILPGLASMKSNTVIGFTLVGASFILPLTAGEK